jgi:LacI family transcriptional regulator
LAGGGGVDALFCNNDDLALGAYRGLREAGLRVPDDVMLVGCDGIEDMQFLEQPLTTIAIPVEEMCALAWRFLRRRIENPDTPLQHALLQPTLVVRESSCPTDNIHAAPV